MISRHATSGQNIIDRLYRSAKSRKTILMVLSCVVVFVTTYVLILPAITLDQDEAERQGGIDVPAQTEQVEQVEQVEQDEDLQSNQDEDQQADAQQQDDIVQTQSGSISSAGKGYEVSVDCDGAGIPEDAELKVRELKEDSDEYVQHLKVSAEKLDIDEEDVQFARFFDIAFVKDGEEVEPESGVPVRIELKDVPKGSEQQLKVLHFENDGPVIMDSTNSVEKKTGITGMEFETESFSVYGVIVEPGPTGTGDLNGKTFTISREGRYLLASTGDIGDQGNGAIGFQKGSQSDAPVWKLEQVNGSTYYISTVIDGQTKYMNLTECGNNRANASLSDTKQVFTVDAANGGYRLSALSNGRRYYLDEHNGTGGNGFAGYAGQSNNGILTFNFTSPVLENNNEYMVLVKQTADDEEADWYIVLNDGKLAPVEYDETTNKVKVDNPMLWYYTGDHIYHHSKEVGFQGNNLPSDYYYKYIDPSSDSGLNEDNESNTTRYNNDGPHVSNRSLWNGTSLTYTNHQIKNASNQYIKVNQDATAIAGGNSQGPVAEIYLAKVTAVPESSNRNHTVNHIDISITGGATLDKPLAYGDYYYYDANGVKRTLTVSPENNVTLHLEKESIKIEPKDMKNSEITAYSEKSGVLNNAFYISGYSGNHENSVSTAQVRIEGSFKVADLDPYENVYWQSTNYWDGQEVGVTQQQLNDRLANRIYYTITVKKDLNFPWLYQYGVDGQGNPLYAQLLDVNEQPLSSDTTVNLSKSFDYWDPDNECPPIKEINSSRYIPMWEAGHIIFDTAGYDGSGMDFKLEAHAVGDSDPAIEITKTLLTDTGEVLSPKSPVTNTFVVYQKRNCSQSDYDSVINVGIGEGEVPAPDGLYNGYSGIHAKTVTVGDSGEGLVYDYDVKAGMTYIKEDENSIHQEIVDKDGKRWKYVSTYVETEYAWRQDGDEGKLHHADGLTSIPEVVGGPYGTYINGQGQQEALTNNFLPFYVYNIYERADDTVELPVTKTWDDFATSEYKWETTFKLQYKERKISGDGEDHAVTTWTDYEPVMTVTLEKEAGTNKWTVTGSFGELPKYREDDNGNRYERQYSAEETSFHVWKVVGDEEKLLYSYDGEDYTFGDGADESIYKPFYDHDANENWDGDWHLQISNHVGQKIEPRNINIGLQKTWLPSVPSGASAKFVLKRYKQTEFVDYQDVQDNANIEVRLQDMQGNVLSKVYTKSGLPMYIDATFAPNKTGTLTFQYAGNEYSVANNTAANTKVTVRSDPITVTGSDGSTVIVRLTAGDLENLAEGTAYNLRITDRHPEYAPALDESFSQEVTFPIQGKTGAEAWKYTFADLPVEEGEWNPKGTLANITIYSYYLVEEEMKPSGYAPEIKDSEGNVISKENRIYNNETVTATNTRAPDINITVKKVDMANVNDPDADTLPGAVFTLKKFTGSNYQEEDPDWTDQIREDTGQTGLFSFTELKEGYYKLVETECPTGYIKSSEDPRFRVKEVNGNLVLVLIDAAGNEIEENVSDTVTIDNTTINVGNESGAELPNAGGPGTIWIYLIGSLLLLGCGIALVTRRRMRI